MTGASPEAAREQQRRGYRYPTSERSRTLSGARVVWEARGMKNWVCGGLVNVGGAADGPCCARDRQPENTRNISLVIYVYSRKMKGKRKDEEGTERRT